MTIKHAIPNIEWAIELLYNSVKTGSQLVLETRSWRQVVVEKASTQQKLGHRASVWATLKDKKDTNPDGHKSGVNMLHFCSVSDSLSHTTLSNKVRCIFSKEPCRSSLLCRCIYTTNAGVQNSQKRNSKKKARHKRTRRDPPRLARILRRVLETWRDLLVIQIPLKDRQLTLVCKTIKREIVKTKEDIRGRGETIQD